MLDSPPESWGDFDDSAKGKELWSAYRTKIESTHPVPTVIGGLQSSGAQFGAAMNAASVFARHGYATGMGMAPEGRRITLTKFEEIG